MRFRVVELEGARSHVANDAHTVMRRRLWRLRGRHRLVLDMFGETNAIDHAGNAGVNGRKSDRVHHGSHLREKFKSRNMSALQVFVERAVHACLSPDAQPEELASAAESLCILRASLALYYLNSDIPRSLPIALRALPDTVRNEERCEQVAHLLPAYFVLLLADRCRAVEDNAQSERAVRLGRLYLTSSV